MHLSTNHISIMDEVGRCKSFSGPIYAHDHISFQLGATGFYFRISLLTGERSWVSYPHPQVYNDKRGNPKGHLPVYHTFEFVFSAVLYPHYQEDLIYRFNLLKEDRTTLNEDEKRWKTTMESDLLYKTLNKFEEDKNVKDLKDIYEYYRKSHGWK